MKEFEVWRLEIEEKIKVKHDRIKSETIRHDYFGDQA